MNTSQIKKPKKNRGKAKKKVVLTGNKVEDAVATKVADQIDQQLEAAGDEDSLQFESQETPRGGAGADDESSNRNGDDSVSYGKSLVSEPDDEEKKSDTQSSRKDGAGSTNQFYPSPDKYERILDVLKSEEKDASSANDARAQTEAI